MYEERFDAAAPALKGETIIMRARTFAAGLLFLSAGLAGCGGHGGAPPMGMNAQPSQRILKPLDTHGSQPGPAGTMMVSLGDAAPVLNDGASVQHLYLGIKEIDVTDAQGTSTVLASYDRPRIVDVTKFQDGNGSEIANGSVPFQQFSQIRVVVDTNASSIVYGRRRDWTTSPLNFLTGVSTMSTAGAGASTATQQIDPQTIAITSNEPYSIGSDLPLDGGAGSRIHVDFNAFESVAVSGGQIVTNPALFVAGDGDRGSISGRVVDGFGRPVQTAVVVAVAANGSVGNTALTNWRGRFLLHTLDAGSYQLVVYNAYTTAAGATFASDDRTNAASMVSGPNVTVTAGLTTDAGKISD